MKILLLAINDWAGLGNLLTQSLLSVGVDAKLYISSSIKYNHPTTSLNIKDAKKFAHTCDIIQYMHSEKVNLNINLSNKNFAKISQAMYSFLTKIAYDEENNNLTLNKFNASVKYFSVTPLPTRDNRFPPTLVE